MPVFAHSSDALLSGKTDPFIDSLENVVIEILELGLSILTR
jgi:hypothetical protein